MTPSTADRPDMSVEDFEELARRAPGTVTLEFINGRLRVKPVPDGDHGAIFMWLLRQCMRHRPDLDLHPEQGLLMDTCRTHRRDRVDKGRAYAYGDVPVYLLVDRDDDTLTVFSEPKDGVYQRHPSYPFGATVPLPAPVGITLDTDRLKDFAH
ncbi:Uma2 family endonuclease [Streptomyces sp. 24-1644]|uniref:Uma2 family endonuclease n=1 Tax=Streptomyces sp. 24-1644 TaxID=3457315 RepID=UPI003FA72609